VISSSGNRALDDTTCRLILKRFRFAPARDAAGMAVPGEVDYDQEWIAPPPLANEGPG
jgi:protein TonB